MKNTILLTGGTGFIGSHTTVELLNAGYDIIIVDNLSNSSSSVVNDIIEITQKPSNIKFYQTDINNTKGMKEIFDQNKIDGVVHFAAYKSVNESVINPLLYYYNNITGLINLLKLMTEYNVTNLVFSSSATVYGNPTLLPLTEKSSVDPINPYGQTKLMSENILHDLSVAKSDFQIIVLRYFNPVGAHVSGLIGENPLGIPNNLFPYILDVISGKRPHLNVYGSDYDTPDGTGVRDYIHVVDLADSHLKALNSLFLKNPDKSTNPQNYKIYNVGTGTGYSVLDIVQSFNKNLETPIKHVMAERRPGDAPTVYADCSLIKEELGWVAQRNLDDMVKDSLNYLYKSSSMYSNK